MGGGKKEGDDSLTSHYFGLSIIGSQLSVSNVVDEKIYLYQFLGKAFNLDSYLNLTSNSLFNQWIVWETLKRENNKVLYSSAQPAFSYRFKLDFGIISIFTGLDFAIPILRRPTRFANYNDLVTLNLGFIFGGKGIKLLIEGYTSYNCIETGVINGRYYEANFLNNGFRIGISL